MRGRGHLALDQAEASSTVAALMMGFAWGVAGVFCGPVLGWFADRVGIEPVFRVLALLPLAGFLLALRLPRIGEAK